MDKIGFKKKLNYKPHEVQSSFDYFKIITTFNQIIKNIPLAIFDAYVKTIFKI